MAEKGMPPGKVPNSDSFAVTTPAEREIVLTRVFSAPRELVFEALSTPEHVRRWWGILDERYSVPVCEIDLRVGGFWRYVCRAPHGDVEFYGEYREIDAPERVVTTEIFAPFPNLASVVTSVLTTAGRKTRLTVSCVYPSNEVRDQVLATGMAHGAALSYDHLEGVLGDLQRG